MEAIELIGRISNGEDSYTQFKQSLIPSKELAKEMVAFANTEGGIIIFGVSDDGDIVGLSTDEVESLGQLIGNCANENVKPAVHPLMENITLGDKRVSVVTIAKGAERPYKTSNGIYYVKSGPDKKQMSQEELLRQLTAARGMSADESILYKSGIQDFNEREFLKFLEKDNERVYKKLKKGELGLQTILENLYLWKEGHLTLAGNLLFGEYPQKYNPSFYIDCCYFDGYDISVTQFISKQTMKGTFEEMYEDSVRFVMSQLRHYQVEKDFNSQARPEISQEVVSELIINALVHRDYYIQSSIKVFMFHDRVEIISPGKLVNSLDIEKIKNGIAIHRNPILSSITKHILPYSGYGTGIKRVMEIDPTVELINDTWLEQFKCIIHRRVSE